MQRLSSKLTVGVTVIYPAIFLTIFGGLLLVSVTAIGTAFMRGIPVETKQIAFACMSAVAVSFQLIFGWIFYFPLKHVFLDEDGLLVQGQKESLKIKLADVARISASEFMNPEIVTLILKQPSKFGLEIKFMPSYRILPWPEHPTVRDLDMAVRLSHLVPPGKPD